MKKPIKKPHRTIVEEVTTPTGSVVRRFSDGSLDVQPSFEDLLQGRLKVLLGKESEEEWLERMAHDRAANRG